MPSAVSQSTLDELAQRLVPLVSRAKHSYYRFEDESNLGYQARLRTVNLTLGDESGYTFIPTSAVFFTLEDPARAVENSKVGSKSAITLSNVKLESFKPYTPILKSDKGHFSAQLTASVESCTAGGDPLEVEELATALKGAEVDGHVVVAVTVAELQPMRRQNTVHRQTR